MTDMTAQLLGKNAFSGLSVSPDTGAPGDTMELKIAVAPQAPAGFGLFALKYGNGEAYSVWLGLVEIDPAL